MNTTRREFIFGAVATTSIAPFAGIAGEVFEDIRVDRYYDLQGGHYGDTGGCGQPGYMEGPELVRSMEFWDHCRELEDKLDCIEKRGFYFTPTQYFGADWRKFDRIYLTKDWMMEFYRRHKDEPLENWELRYKRYLDDVHTGKYSPSNNY